MLRAAIYTRISVDPDGRQTATVRQLEDCRKHIADRGWAEIGVYEDPDISAFKQKVRPSFERLKADIAAGRVDVVVAWKLDRLWRRARDFADLDEACEAAGARIVTVVDGIDTATSAGRMVATMMTGLARAESENISIRQRRKHLEIAQQGRKPGGRRWFGLTANGELEPAEAELVREAARRVLDGEPVYSVAKSFNERGIKTTAGNAWMPQTIRVMLAAPYVVGKRIHRGVLYPAQWPAIITEAEQAGLRRIFGSQRKGPKGPRLRYLTGLLACGKCGAPLRSKKTMNGHPGYACSGDLVRAYCGGILRRAIPLEEMIRDALFEVIEDDAFVERMLRAAAPTVDIEGILAEIRADELALDELAHDRYVSRVLGPSEFQTAHTALTARLEANRSKLASAAPQDGGMDILELRGSVRSRWEAEGVEWRHRLASWLIERIEVGPSPRGRIPFHTASVSVRWRF